MVKMNSTLGDIRLVSTSKAQASVNILKLAYTLGVERTENVGYPHPGICRCIRVSVSAQCHYCPHGQVIRKVIFVQGNIPHRQIA